MRRLCILLVSIMLLVPAFISADEIELGLSVTPLSILKTQEAKDMENLFGTQGGFFQDNLLGLHAGYSLAWLFYASIDANIMPAWWIKKATQYSDADNNLVQGIYAPGFITLVDAGIRPTLGPIILMAELGINYLYIHSAYNKDPETGASLGGGSAGFNLRIGVGYKFGPFSVTLVGTSVYSSFEMMTNTISEVFDGNQMAIDNLKQSLVPSLAFYMHL